MTKPQVKAASCQNTGNTLEPHILSNIHVETNSLAATNTLHSIFRLRNKSHNVRGRGCQQVKGACNILFAAHTKCCAALWTTFERLFFNNCCIYKVKEGQKVCEQGAWDVAGCLVWQHVCLFVNYTDEPRQMKITEECQFCHLLPDRRLRLSSVGEGNPVECCRLPLAGAQMSWLSWPSPPPPSRTLLTLSPGGTAAPSSHLWKKGG